ncbi:MAG: pyridoxal phosphate-dependent aminotransferase family protein, partial [Flavobacteriaceae bacterium]|nr:pyridoxal phosphate-dependent aminotransferase family protein [Flavobacteriaceae bacterium]
FGSHGQGLVQELGLEEAVFARIITFGKALGCHGAAILGSALLKQYLINFARPFIYTTALPPHAIATIIVSYKHLGSIKTEYLQKTIRFFISELTRLKLNAFFIESKSPIQSCILPGNSTVKTISEKLHEKGFDVKAILSPTVQEGQERLRFCIHSFNTEKEISEVLKSLSTTIKTHESDL